ncbi:NAD-dependent epimerase/dehydratase family protein [Mesorhizobium sp. M0243]|uniref:NAD-dependent epimerase/dehydratase family protein n=1 Tax=Mesorhizobium sp. M0243 TaxID=2956925 RepID=UPI0033354E96
MSSRLKPSVPQQIAQSRLKVLKERRGLLSCALLAEIQAGTDKPSGALRLQFTPLGIRWAYRRSAIGGYRVRALVLAGDDVSQLRQQGVEIVTGDIRDMETVRAFVAGAEGAVLIHMAGVVHPKTVAQFEAINTQGTINLLTAARRAIVMSSNSPIGCSPHLDHRFTEESPYNRYMGYSRSKMLMQKAVRAEIAAGNPMEVVLVRAPWFYGPNQPSRQTFFFKMVKNGKFSIVGLGRNRGSMAILSISRKASFSPQPTNMPPVRSSGLRTKHLTP